MSSAGGGFGEGAALAGAGKRAAFGLFYGPLHFLLVRHIVSSVPELTRHVDRDRRPRVWNGRGRSRLGQRVRARRLAVQGVDRHPWAVDEARETYRIFGLRGRARVDDVAKVAAAGAKRGGGGLCRQ